MFIGRTKELKFLDDYYGQKENNLLVLYGRRGIGKTELLHRFSLDKQCIYYHARECSKREQYFILTKEWEEIYHVKAEEDGYGAVLRKAAEQYSVFIIDEFHNMLKNGEKLAAALNGLLTGDSGKKVLVILCSSSIHWVENDMANSIGSLAESISAFLKIKELTFADIMNRFPSYDIEQCITVYSILGGVPDYLNLWSEKQTLKENIERLFLHKNGRLYKEAESYLKTELRELSLYNTILMTLAEGNNKLNDIYEKTGFSRAKISVYIKNLIELDVLKKQISYEKYGKDILKGLYCYQDRMLHFWYRFVFPNLTRLEQRKMKEVYVEKIAYQLTDYAEPYFIEVCKEYLKLLSEYKKIPYQIEQLGSWYGKDGQIDIIGETTDKKIIFGKCKWSQEVMNEEELMEILNLLIQAEIEPDYYFLFSKNGFTDGLEVKARGINNMTLLSLEDM